MFDLKIHDVNLTYEIPGLSFQVSKGGSAYLLLENFLVVFTLQLVTDTE